ncbi:hypothetical protein [Chryseobacterium sp.]|uniref:plasmid mobilization protein n=1 Tax=Chryseobacterium sp. TaxID=1871047 RepID=UPI0025C70257|nr:hypothetical protein [Chryseobacterium sp.]
METTKKSTFKVLFYFKNNAPKKNGKVTVMCRITVNGKQSAFSTKLDISATNWNLKYGRVLGKSREAQVKLLNANFSDKKASAYLYKLEKQTLEMKELLLKVVNLTAEFEKKYLNKE